LLPYTHAIFGRESKPAAHYLYNVTDPEPKAKIGYLDEKSEMICELRLGGGGKGAQTMFPGSIHPDGEAVEWVQDGQPNTASCAALQRICSKIAIGTLLMRNWFKHGRHDGALCVGGFLARAGWEEDEIGNFIANVARCADDEEWEDRERAARDSHAAHMRGEHVAGLPKLIEYLGEEIAKKIATFADYQEADAGELLERMNEKYCVVPISGKVRVVTWEEERGRKVPRFYGFEDFRGLLNNKKVRKGNKQIGIGSWWLDHEERRQYDGLVFQPDQESVVDNRLNLWQGWAITPRKGSWRLLLRHIYRVLANGDKASFKYIMKWTAWALQNPDQPAEVSLVFRGGQGTGRGIFARSLKAAFGQHGMHISSREHLVGRFNAHMMDCALLFVDEAYWPGDKQAEGMLKRMHTEPTLTIEKKGIDPIEVPNALKLIITSNEEWVVPVGPDARRYAVFDVSEKRKQDRVYFKALYAETEAGGVAAMMYELLAMDLQEWHPRNDVPQTNALQEQKVRSLSGEEEWWLGLLQSGELPGPTQKEQSHPRLAQSKALFEHVHKTVLALRYMTEHRLGALLKSYGCNRDRDWRINGHRAWEFPTLKAARAAWDKRMKAKTQWDNTEEWGHTHDIM
jgi:hypothetical protein